jgi:UPF0755 protein
MSQLGLRMTYDEPPKGRKGVGRSTILPILGSLAALGIVALMAIVGIRSLAGGPNDFSGDGTGSVTVVINPGDSIRQMGRALANAGVIATSDAFVSAADSDNRAQSIAPGTYKLRSGMSAASAISLLLDPASRDVKRLVIPEGWRADKILATASKVTGIPLDELKASFSHASDLGLPAYAKGNAEGFLFPATYEFSPKATADDVVQAMIQRFNKEASTIGLESAAAAQGLTPLQVVTMASILEVETPPAVYGKGARVLYNRLDQHMRLQLDSTVNYALGTQNLQLTADQLNVDSPYNTYKHEGLPPGPIDSPGDAALQSALNPAKGKWLYFLTTDPATQTTEFANTYEEFLALKRKYQANVG